MVLLFVLPVFFLNVDVGCNSNVNIIRDSKMALITALRSLRISLLTPESYGALRANIVRRSLTLYVPNETPEC